MEGFANGSDRGCERKKIIKKDSKTFDLSNWKDGFVIHRDKEGCSQIKKGSCWDGEENQELRFEDSNSEMPARLQVRCQLGSWICKSRTEERVQG